MSSSPITSATLRMVADSLDDLAKTAVRVDTFTVAGVAVRVRWHDDQRDGAWYEVLGIGDHSDSECPCGT